MSQVKIQLSHKNVIYNVFLNHLPDDIVKKILNN